MDEKRPADVLTLDSTKNEGHDEGDGTLGNSPSKEDLSRPAERPKLNLKPRSQPAESGVDLDSSGNVRSVTAPCSVFPNSFFCTDSFKVRLVTGNAMAVG